MQTRWDNTASAVHSGRKPAFQTLVVYEDFAAGRRATETCNLLMARLGDEFELRCSMWKFEVLQDAKLNQVAAAEATEADTIIIATHGASPLPEVVTDWIDAWLTLRGEHPAALIALVDSAYYRKDRPSAVCDYLRKVAAAAHMDLLTQVTPFTINEAPAPMPALPVKPAAKIPPATEFSRLDTTERHWGINE